MSLANLVQTITYSLTLPISKKEVKYRPFLVKEQRILLQAQEEGQESVILSSLFDVLGACTFNEIVIKDLGISDFEYLMLQIRAKSVGSALDVYIPCNKCSKRNEVSFTIDDLKVTAQTAPVDNPIDIGNGLFIEMKYPNIGASTGITSSNAAFDLIASCIKSIISADNVLEAANYERSELLDFIDALDSTQFGKLQKFIETMPSVYLPVKFTCKHCGEVNESKQQGLINLFT